MKPVKILTISSEPLAIIMGQILNDRGIPHIMRSYHDSVYDGLWQTDTVWGHLEAPEEYREAIMEIYEQLSDQENIVE